MRTVARSTSCEAHEHLPVKVRPKEGPSHLCSSPSAFGETWASEYGVKSALGNQGRMQATGPQHEAKSAAS